MAWVPVIQAMIAYVAVVKTSSFDRVEKRLVTNVAKY